MSVRSVSLSMLFFFLPLVGMAQERAQTFKGWPGYDDISDLKGCFANPPKGYGNVPFYWWTGDPLDMARLREQLEILSDSATDGLCVSYNHTHDKVDIEVNAQGHGNCGRVSEGSPRVMSRDWWEIWNSFSAECAKKGIGLGMDDYVLAWPGNGEHMDSVILSPGIREYQGLLETVKLPADAPRPENALTVSRLSASAPDSVTYICTVPAPWLHPQIGGRLIEEYFQRFYDNMDAEGRKGMNYFFQDELQYDLRLTSWCEDMPQQFLSRKGYDIVPHLDRLFITDPDLIDDQAAKVRLDYAQVLTQLAEERFFKPVFDWNAEKGLIYGCDNEGRGLNPLRYLDYFRAVSWFTAPGNDAPSRGSSFRQTKVSSSIAHLYGRPRTWLEAFHSIGWDANGTLLKSQLDHHIIAGGNLLCMHGLYYSTHGGWWEWAPPCFHFRMPYWEHMKLWLKYAERLCFLLSQGTHVCDVAVLYPTETMQAIPGTTAESTFKVSDTLSVHGIDYDFIDYQSLQRSVVEGGALKAGGESYKVLVLSDTRALHKETLQKIFEFRRAGGLVVGAGRLMEKLEKADIVKVDDISDIPGVVRNHIICDFGTGGDKGRVLHRRIGERDVYMVMDVADGDTMRFRAWGRAEVWNASDGTCTPVPVLASDEKGSYLRFDGEAGSSLLVVFSPGTPAAASVEMVPESARVQNVDGDWDVEIVPRMNNRWGDFRLPASDEYIGVEAREFVCETDGSLDIYGYAPYMLAANVDSSADLDSLIACGLQYIEWTPYFWSWQFGVKDNPGGQGWHGLKAKVDPRFLILDRGGHQFFKTNLFAPEKGSYQIFVEGVNPDVMLVDDTVVKADTISLSKGWHTLLLAYANTEASHYVLAENRGSFTDERARSMVVFYPEGCDEPVDHGMFDNIVASRWYGTGHLEYDLVTDSGQCVFSFETAPGTTDMSFRVNGSVSSVSVDGRSVDFKCSGDTIFAHLENVNPYVSRVRIVGNPVRGRHGAAFFDGPVKIQCSGGRMPAGDWTQFGALGFYSGGIRYSKEVKIGEHSSVVLDLGEVDATCEVSVNGTPVKTFISKPHTVDITEYVHEGANRIEVLVYSSLSNHYRTIPSPYRGTPRAGLIGPVRFLLL